MRKAENMADRWDDESVGGSSSHRLHGVRQAVKELMKEALHSKENSELLAELTESRPSDLLTLTRWVSSFVAFLCFLGQFYAERSSVCCKKRRHAKSNLNCVSVHLS